MKINIKHYSCIIYLSTSIFILILMSCSTASNSLTAHIQQSNTVRILEKNGSPDKEKIIWVVLQAPGLDSAVQKQWRKKCMPNALESAGLKNYKVLDLKIQQLKASDINCDYLIVVFLNNLKGANENSLSRHWLSLTTSVYDFPQKSLIVRLGGSATVNNSFDSSNACGMCGLLIEEMVKNIFST